VASFGIGSRGSVRNWLHRHAFYDAFGARDFLRSAMHHDLSKVNLLVLKFSSRQSFSTKSDRTNRWKSILQVSSSATIYT
jgi:hypothetical protein